MTVAMLQTSKASAKLLMALVGCRSSAIPQSDLPWQIRIHNYFQPRGLPRPGGCNTLGVFGTTASAELNLWRYDLSGRSSARTNRYGSHNVAAPHYRRGGI